MAVQFIDGFDKYGVNGSNSTPFTNLLTAGEWTTLTTNGGTWSLGPPLAGGVGLSLVFTAGNANGQINNLSKTLPAPTSPLIGGFRFQIGSLASANALPLCVQATKATTAQWSITINASTGNISLRTGGQGGTALGTSSASITAGVAHYLEWNITVGASAAYNIYLDGVSILSGTGNTRGDGANNNADSIAIINNVNNGLLSTALMLIDDLYFFDNTGGTNNAPLLTNPRVETTYTTGDSQTQFSYVTSTLGSSSALSGGGTNAPGANELFLRRFIPAVSVSLNSVSTVPGATSAGANFKAVIYPDSGGSPAGQTLIATGNQTTGATSGTTLTSTFSSPPSLTGGTPYWIGFITDTSVALNESDTTTTGVKASNTYGSGAPGTCPSVTTAQPSWQIWGNVSGGSTNWSTQNERPPEGILSYVQSSTVNNEDLYTFNALSATPQNIYTVAVKLYCENSDAGSRTVAAQTKSGSTDSHGSAASLQPLTTFSFLTSFFDTDPNTSAAWTGSGLNAAISGPKVLT